MSGGLLALFDDIAAIAKVAAASLDDAAAQAAKAGVKAAGIVIDDAAVTPRYVVGFAADRELPIVFKIAMGSIRNKFLFLLPGALLLKAFAPWLIPPLLIIGGAFLCFEGFEKVHEMIWPKPDNVLADVATTMSAESARALEDKKVAGAIRTDMILSAEIMAITLASIEAPSVIMQAVVLGIVALAVTVAVYGTVAIIVKADDFGVFLARRPGVLSQAIGRSIVAGMPTFLKALSLVGTLAMLWVGGGIIVHSLHGYGITWIEDGFFAIAKAIGGPIPVIGGFAEWLIAATCSGLVGLAIGWLVVKALHVVGPMLGMDEPAH